MKYLLVVLMAVLTGCASAPPAPRYVSEKAPTVTVPDEPAYAVDSLPQGTRGADMQKALTASLRAARGHIKDLRALLKPYEEVNDPAQDNPTH